MPLTLPNLYCTPADVFDELSSEGVQLRLDDHNQATGQVVLITAGAASGASSLQVTALASPLLAGSVLEFDGGGLAQQAEVTLSATASTGSTTLTVNPLPVALPQNARAYDNGVNTALAYRLAKACSYATAQVKLYCCGRYDDADLVRCWSANRWATALAKRRLCRRRGMSAPKSVEEDAEEALDEMKAVRVGQLSIEDIGTRTSGWPFFSNVGVDLSYDYNRLRVQPQLSEPTVTQYAQLIDWNAAFTLFEF